MQRKPNDRSKTVNAHVSSSKLFCNACKGSSHTIYNCDSFLKLNISDRISEARRLRLCLNCLKLGHSTKECKLQLCRKCNRKHNVLLHLEVTENNISKTNTVCISDKPYSSQVTLKTPEPPANLPNFEYDPSNGISYANHSIDKSQILLS